MTSMFPTPAGNSGRADRNRAVLRWRQGDPRPRVVTVAGVLLGLCALILAVSGVVMILATPPETSDPDTADWWNTIATALTWLGAAEIVIGLAVAALMPGMVRGDARRRSWCAYVAGAGILVTLACWVFFNGGLGQALIALVLALSCLAMYRPAVSTYYHREPEQ
jgi:cell division protein FtsW (lipid II flippase)